MDPDQAQQFVSPDLIPNYLPRLSANSTSRHRVKLYKGREKILKRNNYQDALSTVTTVLFKYHTKLQQTIFQSRLGSLRANSACNFIKMVCFIRIAIKNYQAFFLSKPTISTLVLLNLNLFFFENSVDQDQLASPNQDLHCFLL